MAMARGWDLLTLKSNLGGVDGLDEVSGYGAVELRGPHALLTQLSGNPLHLAALGGACFVVAPSNVPWSSAPRVELTQAWPALGFSLLKMTDCVPRLHGVQRVFPAKAQEESLSRVVQPGFDSVHHTGERRGRAGTFVRAARRERGPDKGHLRVDPCQRAPRPEAFCRSPKAPTLAGGSKWTESVARS